jgi:hypothetical protein
MRKQSLSWHNWLAVATGALVAVASLAATLRALMPPAGNQPAPMAAQSVRTSNAAANSR